ncbi:MAG TPA: heme NO-binding domain-containing protein [Ktedonobacterales bacterium]|jgi:hypothetical protein
MQGFIHLLLEAYVSETAGAQSLRLIRQMAGIQGPPLATQPYPDQVTTKLLQAIADYEGRALDDLLYRFGVYFLNAPLTRQNYRAFLEGHSSARSFLEHVPMIHQHLGNTLKGASLPRLQYINHTPELLEIIYDSPRHLCHFLRGVLDGVSRYFNEPLEVREMECQYRGASACRILVRFVAARRSGPLPQHPSAAGAKGSAPYHPSRAPGSGPQSLAAEESPAQRGEPAGSEAKRQREEQEDMLILQTLSTRQAPADRSLGSAQEQPLDLALSLFEIAQRLAASEASAEYARLSQVQRSLTRLAVQGFVESKQDLHTIPQSASPGVVALAGQGILAAQRYRITPVGQIWLRDMQQRRQGY